MARRYETITELYHETIAGLAAPQVWQSFLTTACHNFRLPFDEQVLLFAQRPDATAVLPIDGKNGWNQRFGRWVNRGATGIAVFDGDAVGRSRLKYYFDISDTHESRFARPVPIWTMRPEYEPAVTEALENSFGELEDKQLINEYCMEVFEQEADFSNLSHVDLAFSSTSDSEHTIEIFADLTAFRLVYQVDGEIVHEIACESLSELNGYLANLDFDEMVAHADDRYQQEHADRGELAEQEPEPKEPAEKEQSAVLAPPKPKRERVVFTTLHPEIPADQRRNFHITDPELGHGTRSEKYAANVAAIRTLKQIEAEERLATPEEQEILSRYVGWGGLADCFDERHGKYLELKSLLSEDEYAAARASSLTAFYTSPVIIGAMYQALSQMGFRQGNILEPSCGVGNFIGMLPDSMADSKVYGVEIDSISGRIAQQLYQNSSIAVNGFEKVQMPDSFFDVAIGNVPFSGDQNAECRRHRPDRSAEVLRPLYEV